MLLGNRALPPQVPVTYQPQDDGFLRSGDPLAPWLLVLAHGAGAPMDSPFMNEFSERLVAADPGSVQVVRFEFPYMRLRRELGGRRPPNPMPQLVAAYESAIEAIQSELRPDQRLLIGGKSMGGRVASMIADDSGVSGVVCLGYPFHPTGRPERLRVKHLKTLQTSCLICQGTRDALGNREEVAEYPLASSIAFHWLEDGDHSFKPRKRSGYTHDQHLESAVSAVAGFLRGLPSKV